MSGNHQIIDKVDTYRGMLMLTTLTEVAVVTGTKDRRGKLSPFREQLLEEMRRQLAAVADEDLQLRPEEQPAVVASRLLAQRRVRSEWDDLIGPFYEASGLLAWMGMKSRQNITDAARRGDILAVTAGRRHLYPTFQFSNTGETLPGLRQVLAVLRSSIGSAWTQALWLNTPVSSLGNRTPAQALRAGATDEVLRLARVDAEQRAS